MDDDNNEKKHNNQKMRGCDGNGDCNDGDDDNDDDDEDDDDDDDDDDEDNDIYSDDDDCDDNDNDGSGDGDGGCVGNSDGRPQTPSNCLGCQIERQKYKMHRCFRRALSMIFNTTTNQKTGGRSGGDY